MMNDDLPLEPGTKVMVTRIGEPHNSLVAMEEAGTVLGIGLEYAATGGSNEDTTATGGSGSSSILRDDGILVKLQISNTRGIFPPSQVQRLEAAMASRSSPPPSSSKRRSSSRRRNPVTPSPSVLEQIVDIAAPNARNGHNEDESSSSATPEAGAATGRVLRKRNLDQVDAAGDQDAMDSSGSTINQAAVVAKTSKHFRRSTNEALNEGKNNDNDNDDNNEDKATSTSSSWTKLLRVQVAPSSSSKCLECQQSIAKNFLRLQLASQKRGWYHVACAKESASSVFSFLGGVNKKMSASTFTEMEGYLELSPAEQRLLRTQLNEEEADDEMEVEEEADDNGEDDDDEEWKQAEAEEEDDDEEEEASSDVAKDPPQRIPKKKAQQRKKRAAPNRKNVQEEEPESEATTEDPPLAALKKTTNKTKKPQQKKKATSKRKKNEEDEGDNDNDDGMLRASDTDSDDEKDMPYRVEYATTGRAACRGCDERIAKGLLRVAESPLFRGKPGFTVYRHLQCTIFPEDIVRLEDVGGWRRLKKADRETVTKRVEESKVLVEKENQEIQPDELVQVGFEGEIRSSPKGLAAALLPFQVEGCSWMFHQELHIPEIRGGILADEMGMGKTLQTITTILDNRPKLQWAKPGAKHPPNSPDLESLQREERLWKDNLDAWQFEMDKCNVPKKLITQKAGKKDAPMGARAGTLVVCPVIALYQWREEIKKFTEDKALSVCCYHGPNRAKEFPRELLCKYDVVLTTYQVIESDFRKMVSPNKVKCPNCGGGFRIDKLKVHLKYFCGESAQRTEAQARQHRTADRPTGGGGRGGRGSSKGGKGGKGGNKKQKTFKSDDKAKSKPKQKAMKIQLSDDSDSPYSDRGQSDESSSDDSWVGAAAKKKAPPPKAKKGRKAGKKKQLPDDDDSSSSEISKERDPMEGIDLDKLLKEAMEGSRASVLHTMCWWRVVLDEAHMIKSRSSQTAAAAFALTSIHRWCLSGTPLQNRVGELYSLIRFLRIDPMAHYFCRKQGCDCKSVHYRMLNGKCLDCNHGTIQHYSHFNKHVLNPIQRAGYQGDGRRAMMKLKNDVLDKCLLRRTKESRAEDMNLPPRVVNIRTVRMHPIEEDFYNALYTQTKSSFDDYVTEGTLLNNYAHIFDLLTKMRQAVDHPYLIVYSKKNAGKFSAPGAPAVANGSTDCELCHEPPTDRVVSSCCGSAFCRCCVVDYMSPALENLEQGTLCPVCRAPFSIDMNQESSDVVDDSTLTVGTGSTTANMPSLKEMAHVSSGSILRRINLAEFATSTKVEALVQELVQMRQQRPGSKALVFSQFVNMLDLIRWRLHSDPCLQDLGLGVRIIHGGMNVQSRDEALKDFREDHTVRVLLMSLKAGGVALNLTVANEAYLMDPWWNPAAEMQAIDRTHRLGQYRPIRAVRFIAEGTVEERVLQLQEKKRLVFDGTVGRDAASLKMLTVEDMKAMFA